MFRNVWVTGGTGCVGKSLEKLAPAYAPIKFTFTSSRQCDLTNLHETLNFASVGGFDAIIHLAAKSGGIGLINQAALLRDNVLMSLNILEASKLIRAKTVMTLSAGMYPAYAKCPLQEDRMHNGEPHDSNYGYAFAKRLIEPMIRAYREEEGLNVIGLIPSGIFGEYSNFDYLASVSVCALVRRFYEAKLYHRDFTVWGDGTARREFTYADDIAQIYMWALGNYDSPGVINIGTTEEHSIKEIAYMVADFMDIDRHEIVFDASKPSGIFRRSTDNSKFVKLSHFKYTPLEDGLRQTIKWFIANYNTDRVRL